MTFRDDSLSSPPPSAELEFFETESSTQSWSEPYLQIGTGTEGTVWDLDNTTGDYSVSNVGTETGASRFTFSINTPGVSAGDRITAVAIDPASWNTSEAARSIVVTSN